MSNHNEAQILAGIKPAAGVLRQVLGAKAEARAYLVWRPVLKPGSDRPDKMPVDPVTGRSTKPNDARSRGVLTLDEALAAAEKFEDAGVGIFPPHADLVAIDLDACVKLNGTLKVDAWAQAIISGLYAELSPSHRGLRVLVQAIEENSQLDARSTGHEKDNIGIYGRWTNKFVTLTGNRLPGAAEDLLPLSIENERAIWTRWETEGRRLNRGGVHTSDDYPPGQVGMDQAMDDIVSGSSLHPATMAYVTRAVHTQMTLAEIEMVLHEAYDNSDAKTSDPGRWAARYPSSINSVMRWVAGKQGPQLKDLPTQVVQAAQATWAEFRDKKRELPPQNDWLRDKELELVSQGCSVNVIERRAYGGRGELFIPPEHYHRMIEILGTPTLGGNEEEVVAEAYFKLLYDDGVDLDDMPSGVQWLPIWLMYKQVEEEEDAKADTAAFLADGEETGSADFWVVDEMPAGPMRELVDYCYAGLMRDMPELAVLAALTAISACAGPYAIRTSFAMDPLPLSLWSIALAPSGAGKSVVDDLIVSISSRVGINAHSMPNSAEQLQRMFTAVEGQSPGDGINRVPTVLITVDEFGAWLAKLGQNGKTGTADSAFQACLKLYNRSKGAGAFIGESRGANAAATRARVNNPMLILTGFSTPGKYMQMIQDATLDAGFGNRTLLFVADYNAPKRRRVRSLPFPAGAGRAIEALAVGCHYPSQGEVGEFWRPQHADWHAWFRVMDVDEADEDRIHAREVEISNRWYDHPLRAIAERYAENVLKVAGLISLLDHSLQAVEVAEMMADLEGKEVGQAQWGRRIALSEASVTYAMGLIERLLENTMQKLDGRTAPPANTMEAVDKVRRAARKLLTKGYNGKKRKDAYNAYLASGLVPHTAIMAAVKGLDARTMAAAMETLIGTGEVEAVKRGGDGTKERPVTLYRFSVA